MQAELPQPWYRLINFINFISVNRTHFFFVPSTHRSAQWAAQIILLWWFYFWCRIRLELFSKVLFTEKWKTKVVVGKSALTPGAFTFPTNNWTQAKDGWACGNDVLSHLVSSGKTISPKIIFMPSHQIKSHSYAVFSTGVPSFPCIIMSRWKWVEIKSQQRKNPRCQNLAWKNQGFCSSVTNTNREETNQQTNFKQN